MARLTFIVVVASVMATRATGLVYHEWCLGYKGECVPRGGCPESSGQLSCPDGMVCCPFEAFPCRRTEDCKDVGGKCSYSCKEDELEIPEMCGEDCKCCVTARPCSKTDACKAMSGRCDDRCNRNETPIDGLCVGGGCRCCVPARSCSKTDACKAMSGRCDDRCNRNETPFDGLCVGGGCRCCVPASPCERTEDCKDLGGHCSASCKEEELGFPELCEGDCKCCIKEKPCSKTAACKAISGRCDEKCNRMEKPYEGLCVGGGCQCCVRECKRTDACKEMRGRCDRRCNRNEFPLLGYCTGEGCFCCVRDFDESSVSEIKTSMSSPSMACPCSVNEWPSESSLTASSESLAASTLTSTHFPSMTSAVASIIAVYRTSVNNNDRQHNVNNDDVDRYLYNYVFNNNVDPPVPCNATADCEYLKGECRLSCPLGTRELPGCVGPCVCCVPDDGLCLNTSSECQGVGGTCVLPGPQLALQCDAVDLNLCPSDSSPCACCVGECKRFGSRGGCTLDCTQQTDATCKIRYNGSCKAECNTMELALGTCQEGCSCCGCETTGECDALGGRCVSAEAHCNGNLTGECAGESCFCCLPNAAGERCWWDSPRCLEIAGRCAPSCGAAETGVEGLCGDGGCVCCTSDPSPCLQSTLCGKIGGTCQSECPSYMASTGDLCPGPECSCCYLP
ncbi:hypothetical protein C7M84_008096 [Penaeus vannamei]|uniref:Uncharacterized protein n=1 Tax=Penaeus vannamei TaxID=6689 RepID=A0A3R7PPY2_PENVA|nr:hypothetical protein C7M84_008096 [Penaeus vannamei]